MTTQDSFEVIAAFVDGERVDAVALKAALAQPEGREYLADVVALREVIAHDGTAAGATIARPGRRWIVAAAASVMLSLAGGVALGHRWASTDAGVTGATAGTADVAAPAPTRVIEVAPGASYISQGGK